MRAFSFIVVAGWLGSDISTAAQAPPIRLVPAAAEVQWGEPIVVGGEAAIVVADQADPAEREAARLLGRNIEKRFGRRWPILSVTDAPANVPLRVVLGQPRRFAMLEDICAAQKLTVPSQQDGYALKVWSDGATVTAAVAGATGRGVIYGQDTLFQLFTRRDDTLTVRAAVIRDWPTIPLRGRPHPHYQYFLKPENFDCIMTSRINFIDLRDGIYAFEPGARLNKQELGTVIRQARDRGLRVYAAVNCGVPGAQQDAVLATFREFIELGADGLWASFDDKGAGADPKGMVTRILALGREHGITGDAIAVTPPKGDYQTIRTRFNREIIAVPGMEKAVWYWTGVPCAQDAADAEAVGLRVRPSWWHNWPRFRLPPLHTGSDRSYSPVISLADGWNHPNDEELREMGRYVHAVIPWDGWQAQQHYLVPMIGWWSWRPEQYDFRTVRGRIHDVVFGPGQVETAAAIDDALDTLRGRFRFWATHTEFAPQCPPRLQSPDDRAGTLAELRALQGKLAALREGARTASLLDPQLLEQDYLGPMTREIETGLAAAQAPYPEYWWQEHQDRVLEAIYDGEAARADQLIRRTRDRVLEDVAQVERLLGDSNGVRRYVAWWRARARATAAEWQQLVVR
ncbi:MAG: glycoside hydrolase family 20 zincin-like fold domain-containing protein, partial [Phycisphaerae bacterium]